MFPRQLTASIILSILLLTLIIRLVQKQKLDISYCWLWLAVGFASFIIVLKYEWLTALSRIIGSLTDTTTLFLLGFLAVLLMCLQFSLVISSHRRQLKKLTQKIAILERMVKTDQGTQGRQDENRRNNI